MVTFAKMDGFKNIKGTVSVISSDPSSNDCNAGFTTVPFKPYIWSVMWKFLLFCLGLKAFGLLTFESLL